ncbi:LOW QUALITY PROTEIN: E3 ubiquitin-protein ligase RNF31-like [Acipenser ruthenus]|uniref:LOW QUALITY PROTEIN: E3 ubiquitin-protein ligase RNF31-like n=1 Tax=Acipenser ruthenus TaxID=7906 RepID=UPI0027419EFF|nr:LOW QUALITY PROTEIN: E3 ubiquitin-protein ligase RNF31-like [Acipenser ruthenus]
MTSSQRARLAQLRQEAVLSLISGSAPDIRPTVEEMVAMPLPLSEKYQEIDAESIVRENTANKPQPMDVLPAVSTALNILEKYGRNLVNPSKPKYWRTVKFNNPVFKTTVDPIQGGRSVLLLYGYSEQQKDGLSFPDAVQSPEADKVAGVTLEVMMLRVELEMLSKNTHPHPEVFSHVILAGVQQGAGEGSREDFGGLISDCVPFVGEKGGAGIPQPVTPNPVATVSASPSLSVTTLTGPVRAAAPTSQDCSVCGDPPSLSCTPCDGKLFCETCDQVFHGHPARANHKRGAIKQETCTMCGISAVSAHCPSCVQSLCSECDGRFHMHPGRAWHKRTPVALPRNPRIPGSPSLFSLLSSSSPPKVLRLRSLEEVGTPSSLLPPSQSPSLSQSLSQRSHWQCVACPTLNEARAVLCVGCERPRACKTAPPSTPEDKLQQISGSLAQQWSCQACTMLNLGCSVLCQACERPRLAARPSLPAIFPLPAPGLTPTTSSEKTATQPNWICSHCTFLNTNPGRICDMCDRTSQHPDPSPAPPQPRPQGDVPVQATQQPRPLLEPKETPPQPLLLPPSKATPPGKKDTPLAAQAASLSSQDEADWSRQEEMREEGLKLVKMIREAESSGFSPEQVFAAVHYSGTTEPCDWLRSELPLVLDALTELATSDLQGARLSRQEAVTAWEGAGGDLERAVKDAVRQRRAKMRSLRSLGFHDDAELVSALQVSGGDVGKAIVELQRHLLAPFHQRVWSEEEEDEPELTDPDRQKVLRRLLAVYELASWGRAELVLSLMLEQGGATYCLEDVVQAVRESADRDFIKRMLSTECAVCYAEFPQNRLRSLTSCQCTVCSDCFQQHFTIAVKEKHIRDMVCPSCSAPDISDEAELNSYFSTLDIQLRECLDDEVYQLFHKKLTEIVLMKDPKFLWCSHCSYGFIYEGDQLKVTCVQCRKSFCCKCKKPWEDQHQGLSCEDFQSWKRENDPQYQREGLAGYLKDNGIKCPECRYMYSLSKGGCMHFKCSQCHHEFCSGCNNRFHPANSKTPCQVPDCTLKATIHAHHPRDCLFYMRDWDVEKLRELLQKNLVAFNTDPPPGSQAGSCRVMMQKETADRLVDEPCEKETPAGHAGLCGSHYKEYLVSLINGHSLDPAPLYDLKDLETACRRYQVEYARIQGETDETYQPRILKKLMDSVPLGDKVPRKI